MPVYNEEKTLHGIVERVLARPEVGELVMVNDCSQDGSWQTMQALAKSDPRIRIFSHEVNQGKGAALRTGFENVHSQIVLIQDVLLAPFRAKLFLALEAKAAPGAAPTVTSNQEYGFYVSLVALLMEDLKRNCRGTFIRNNFHRFNEREFETYVSDKAESLWIKAVNFLRDMYPSDKMTLTFEAVEKSVLSEAETDFKDEIVVVFKKAVHIYNERHAEIAEMERALREHLKGYGVNMEKARDHRVEELANDDRR